MIAAARRRIDRRHVVAAVVAVLVVLFARLHGEVWAPATPDAIWTLRIARVVLGLFAFGAVLFAVWAWPRMTRLRWGLLAFWTAWLGLLLFVLWPGTIMWDTLSVSVPVRSLVLEDFFAWLYAFLNVVATDIEPHVWFRALVQVLMTAAVFAYAGDVVHRRAGGRIGPVIVVTALLALSAPVLANTVLVVRDTPFGVLHLLLALVVVDAVAVRRRIGPAGVFSVLLLSVVLSGLRGDGVALLAAPLLLLLLRPSRGTVLRTGVAFVALYVVIRVLLPMPLNINTYERPYAMTLKISMLGGILGGDADRAARWQRMPHDAATKTLYDGVVRRPFYSPDRAADLRVLKTVLDLRRVETLATPWEIPAFGAGGWNGGGDERTWKRFNAVADRLIRDNAATVAAYRLETFAASSALSPGGYFGVPGTTGPDAQNPESIPPDRRADSVARPPWAAASDWLTERLASTAKFSGVRPAGAFLFWNLAACVALLLVPLVVRGRWWPEAVFAAVILIRVPLVFLAAPAAQFKYYYSTYLGAVVCLGLLVAAVWRWWAERRAARADEPGASVEPVEPAPGPA